jgi:hypothetical protein
MVNVLEREEQCTIARKSEGKNRLVGNLWRPSPRGAITPGGIVAPNLDPPAQPDRKMFKRNGRSLGVRQHAIIGSVRAALDHRASLPVQRDIANNSIVSTI